MRSSLAAVLTCLCLVTACTSDPSPDPSWNAESVTAAAIADLAQELEIHESGVIVVSSATPVTWSNGAIGCEQPGMGYTAALVDGYSLVLAFLDTTYPYHQGGDQPPFHCPQPTE